MTYRQLVEALKLVPDVSLDMQVMFAYEDGFERGTYEFEGATDIVFATDKLVREAVKETALKPEQLILVRDYD